MKNISKLLISVFLLGILLRVIFLFWSVPLNINGDQMRYEDWAQVTHIYGFSDSYQGTHVKTVINNMPPGSLYIIVGAYELYILVGKVVAKVTNTAPGSILFVNTFLLHGMMRIPSILTDMAMGIIAYLLVRKEMKEKPAVLAASLIWLNPVIIYNSSIWGQMDSLNNFFFLVSLFLAYRKNYILSILSYATSLYIKVSLLPLLPFYFVFLYYHSERNWRKILVGVSISIAAVIVATIPISTDPVNWLVSNIPAMSGGELQNITVAAFNFWWVVTCGPIVCPGSLPVIGDKFLGIMLNTWGYLLFVLATLPIFYFQIRRPQQFITKKFALLTFGLVAMVTFLFLPKMHDRYLYPFFPLFAVAIPFFKRIKHLFLLYISITIIHMGNLIYSYFPAFYPSLIYYEILYSNLYRWSISLLTLIVGMAIYVTSMKNQIFQNAIKPQSALFLNHRAQRKKRSE